MKMDLVNAALHRYLAVELEALSKSRHEHSSFQTAYPNHLCNVALWSCVLSRVLHLDKHDEEQIMPHVVLHLNVLLKRHRLVVKLVSLQSCKCK